MEVIAQKRDVQGKGASRRLRRSGKTPGVVYGGEKPALSIELDHNTLFYALKRESFHASVLNLSVDGVQELVLLRDFVMHPFRQEVQHIDFQRIDTTHKIHMKVPLHFINAELAPGVKLSGGVVSHVMTEIDISCMVADLPEFIEVNLEHLTAGHSLHANDIKMPKGVVFVGAAKGENPSVVTIVVPRGAVEPVASV